jgi:hypothetical protein
MKALAVTNNAARQVASVVLHRRRLNCRRQIGGDIVDVHRRKLC